MKKSEDRIETLTFLVITTWPTSMSNIDSWLSKCFKPTNNKELCVAGNAFDLFSLGIITNKQCRRLRHNFLCGYFSLNAIILSWTTPKILNTVLSTQFSSKNHTLITDKNKSWPRISKLSPMTSGAEYSMFFESICSGLRDCSKTPVSFQEQFQSGTTNSVPTNGPLTGPFVVISCK